MAPVAVWRGGVGAVARLWRRPGSVEGALLVVGWALLLGVAPHAIVGDGTFRYDALRALLDEGRQVTLKWPLVGTLLASPLYALGKWAGAPEAFVARFNLLAYGAALLAVDRLLAPVLEARSRRRFLLLALWTSMAPSQLRNFGLEGFHMAGTLLGCALAVRGRWALATLAFAVATGNMPATSVGLALCALVLVASTGRLRWVLPMAGAVALIVGENLLRHGLRWSYAGDAGYATALPYSGRPGFSYPLFFGVLSLVFAFGKGLLFFAPGLFVPLREARRGVSAEVTRLRRMSIAYVVGLLLVYSRWWAWYGGDTWGPRFLTFAAVPAALTLALRLRRPSSSPLLNVASLGALLLSCWAGFAALSFGDHHQELCRANNYAVEALCWYVPEFSVLWTPFVFWRSLRAAEWAMAGVSLAVLVLCARGTFTALARQLFGSSRRVLAALWSRRWAF